jgi:hypothetical protein
MIDRRTLFLGAAAASVAGRRPAFARTQERFSFRPYIDRPPSLYLLTPAADGNRVVLKGGDSRRPTIPFTFDWGDGSRSEAFFDAEHTYLDTSRDYRITITAHYGSFDQSDSVPLVFHRGEPRFARDPGIPRRVTLARAPELSPACPPQGPSASRPSELPGPLRRPVRFLREATITVGSGFP